MIRKMRSRRPGYIQVLFELPACLWADRIFLVGDFNDWNSNVTPFVQGRDGVWRASVDLLAGRSYQFRYLVDGAWQTDYHADGWVDNEYGSQNSILNATLDEEELGALAQVGHLHEEVHEIPWAKCQSIQSPAVQTPAVSKYVNSKGVRAAS